LPASSSDAKLVGQVSRPERQHPRYAHEAAITFHTLDRAIAGRSRNVSRGGLCADLAEEIRAGTSIEIDLQLVFAEDQHSEPLRLPARIAWCTAIDDHYQVGVQFLAMHDETAADLMMFLRYLDGRGALQAETPEASPAASPGSSIDERFG